MWCCTWMVAPRGVGVDARGLEVVSSGAPFATWLAASDARSDTNGDAGSAVPGSG